MVQFGYTEANESASSVLNNTNFLFNCESIICERADGLLGNIISKEILVTQKLLCTLG